MGKHPLANCDVCPLRVGGIFVPSEGPERADVALVGEAPGVQEARIGRPFVGPSGKLLNVVLGHNGLSRSDAFLSNATLCRPADGTTPPLSAITACRPRLVEELRSRGASTVVALGNSACISLLGQSGVTKLRIGPGRPTMHLPGVRVIATVHPAACLRQGDLFPDLVADIGKVSGKNEPWNPPDYEVIVDRVSALRVIRRLMQGTGPLAVDIEADIEKDTSHDHPNHYGLLCIGVGHERDKVVVFADSGLGPRVFRGLALLFRRRRLIAQNGKFDLAALFPHMGPLKLWFDTMLASYVFDERPGRHGLKIQAMEYLGAPRYDDEIKQFVGPRIGYGAIPRPILYKYNAYDVACTFRLWEMYERKFATSSGASLRRVHDFLVAASNQLMFTELNGITIDRAQLTRLGEQYREALTELETKMALILARRPGEPSSINPRSPIQVKNAYLKMRVRLAGTDKEILGKVLEKTDPSSDAYEFTELLLEHRRVSKLLGTYVEGLRKRMYRGRVYSTYLLHGTTTGRLSSRNPNLQNVPRGSAIRNLFVPSKPCNVFVQSDYSQAELRVLCFLARDRYFRDIFNAGDRDLFDELTPILYPYANKAVMEPAAWKELRIRVKAYVYGLSYGRQAYSIALEFKITPAEAEANMNKFFAVIPEIVRFREATRNRVLSGRYLETPWGRRRRFSLITEENRSAIMNEALAFIPQSTASDMCLNAFTGLREELRGTAWLRNIVHDSILAECHEDDAEEVAAIMNARMIESAEEIVGDYVTFATDYKIGRSWGAV